MADIQGFYRDGFLGVREAFEKSLDSGAEERVVMNKHVEAGGYDERAMSVVRAAYDSLSVVA